MDECMDETKDAKKVLMEVIVEVVNMLLNSMQVGKTKSKPDEPIAIDLHRVDISSETAISPREEDDTPPTTSSYPNNLSANISAE
jgi:hypothetical protein|mmetsp:Transcript_10532/g.23185  ORF Transcript_10532/g.23185 Transcript_10532/m.23185 type:complete len:85 (+) Transcript_10532:433-687(+)